MSAFLKTIQQDGNGGPYKSFNNDYHLINETTKVVIVGTITSPQGRGMNKDFYYMSPYNPMYRILDAYFKTTSFVKNKKMGNIDQIIKELKEKRIAFIDVIESCKNPYDSSLDDELTDIKLDYKSFEGINKNIILIANSKNAYQALLKIARKNKLTNEIRCVYAFRFYKQENWDKVFQEIGL